MKRCTIAQKTRRRTDIRGDETVREEDNSNRIQNRNSDEPNPGSNAVMEIRGKFEIKIGGKYRVALRGRDSAALYVSED